MPNFTPEMSISQSLKYFWPKKGSLFSEFWRTSSKQNFHFLSRSSYSLSLICEFLLGNEGTLWLPDYFCNQALTPTRSLGIKLAFYPITSDRKPNWDWCEKNIKNESKSAFLLVHYFGEESETLKTAAFCKQKDLFFVEDASQVFLPFGNIGKKSDFTFYSLHKFFPIPNGSMISTTVNSEEWAELTQRYNSVTFNLKWHLKSLFKNVIPRIILLYRYKKNSINATDNSVSSVEKNKYISKYSINYLSHLTSSNIESIIQERKNNTSLIKDLLNDESTISYTPYVLSYYSKNCLVEINKFKDLFLFGSFWPDLAPEILEQSQNHQVCIDLKEKNAIFPVYDGLKTEFFVKRFFLKFDKNFKSFKLKINVSFKKDWDQKLFMVPKSNILQSWQYGDAKASESWHSHRLEIYNQERVVAIAQILEKKIPYINVSIYRLNRGPLFLNKESANDIYNVYKVLKNKFSIFRLKPLIAGPWLLDNLFSYHILKKFFLVNFTKSKYHSSFIDLRLTEEELRKNLNSKWRNLLKKSETMNLALNITSVNSEIDWIIKKYQELMELKSFTGVPIHILKSLINQQDENFKLFMLQAIQNEIPLAGILIGTHGNSATYLVGWNGDQGRSCNANHFLLWNALIYLKKKKYLWFDLGGLDFNNLQSISHFKRGLNGKEYKLMGEWL